MNRRDAIKLSGVAAYGLAQSLRGSAAAQTAATDTPQTGRVERWGVFEASFQGPDSGNPFLDVQVTARFRKENRIVTLSGFYDGGGVYRVRFMPDDLGQWSYEISSNAAALNGKNGVFECVLPGTGNHGPVSVSRGRHFAYADGTPFAPFGTTCYAWTHQPEELEEETLQTLAGAPFNKVRMLVFPKSYLYNQNEPIYYPFPRNAAGENDTSIFNVKFFQHLEKRIRDLSDLGIQADVILFHPYDRWGYQSLAPEVNDRYLRYLIARIASQRNVWWSLANEYDLIRSKTTADWNRIANIVEEEDPSHHLRSLHYGRVMYDYSRAWVTHASLQSYDFGKARQWFFDWNKPIIYDEMQYEGNIPAPWGNLSAEEMTRRFWMAIVSGCYATHGETYLDPADILWWSKGGKLHGQSPERIGFLRKLVEEYAAAGLSALGNPYPPAAAGENVILYYLDYHRPAEYTFRLPPGVSYRAQLIDPWNMKTTPVEGVLTGTSKMKLPGRPYQAVVFRKTS